MRTFKVKSENLCLFVQNLSGKCSISEQNVTIISEDNKNYLERVQKTAQIIIKEKFCGYQQGLAKLDLESLECRRENLCLNFANKCTKSDKLKHMFHLNPKYHDMKTVANTGRLQNSPIVYMQKLLNADNLEKQT